MNITKKIGSIVLAVLLMVTLVLPGVGMRASAAGLDNTVISLFVNNLQYYLPFDGSCVDATTGKATAENNVTYVQGKYGQAAQFTQNNSYVKLTDLTSYPADYSFSINLWIKDNQTGGDPGIFSNKNWGSGSNPGFIFSTRTDNICFNVNDAAQSERKDFETSSSIADGTWHMFSATVDRGNGTVDMYIDSVNVGQGDISSYAGQALTALDTMIGNDGTGNYQDAAPNEDIDDFMLFNKALSEAEVQALYGAGDAMPRMYYSATSLSLANGESATPILIKTDSSGISEAAFSGVTYASADPSVATVDNTGKITAVTDSGTTAVTASAAWGISAYGISFPLSATINVTVGTVAEPDTPVQTYSSQAIYGTPTIDGIMDSVWDNCPTFDVFRSGAAITAIGRAMWDNDNLYVLVDVSDDTPYALSPQPEVGTKSGIGVKNDSVDIWINWNDKDSVTYSSYEATHFLIDRNNSIGTSFPEWSDVTAVTHAVVADNDHYIAEVAIPLSGAVNKDNWPQFGFNISVNDDDDGDNERETYVTWLNSGAAYWTSPSGLFPVYVVENYVVQPAAITTGRLWDGTVGFGYEQMLAADGSDILWSINGGALPSGLTLSSTGTLSGTPTVSGAYTFTVKAANSVSEDTKELSICINDVAEQPDAGSGKVVFGTFADSHSGGSTNMEERVAKVLQYFNSQGANAAVCVGDLTNNGLQSQYDAWASVVNANKGNVELIACMGNHEGGTASLFTAATGDKPNADYVVNGYHFITLSPGSGTFDPGTGLGTSMGGGNFSYVRAWLEERLAAAVAEDPTKPIMVFFHQPMYGTHYVSDEWPGSGLSTGSGDTFESVFDNYPQAVCFSAHIHSPNNNPLSIWQDGGFTTVNVPTTFYLEMESGMIYGTTPPDSSDIAQVSLVELDGSKVTIINRDLLADQDISTWTFDVSKPEEFPYTSTRADLAEAPVFPDSAEIRVSEITDTSALINFDQAKVDSGGTGDIVHSYRYDFINKATGSVDLTFKTWSEYYVLPMPATISQAATGLASGTQYELKIYAIDAYGKISGGYISKTFITSQNGKALYAVTFDSRGGSAVDQQIITSGAPATRPADSVRSGYIFKGWYSDAVCTTAWDFTTPVTGEITLYAGWAPVGNNPGGNPGDNPGGGSTDGSANGNNNDSDITNETLGGTTTVSGKVSGTTNDSGKISASVDEELADALVEGAKDVENNGQNAVVKVTLEGSGAAASAKVTISKRAFSQLADETNAALSVETGLGTVIFDASAVSGINAAASSGDISIDITKADTAGLSDEEKAAVGDRPVYDFTLTSGDTTISGFGGGSASISLPYTPVPGEDPNAIVVYYISNSGELQTVRGKYDSATGTVQFTTTHFSRYAIGYNKVAFSDVVSTDWYYKPVTFIAARGITTGSTANTFSPNNTLTRGQFIVMLMRAYGIEADTSPADNFSDAGDTYYSNYLAAAKRLGISTGVGDNTFAPDSEITRQDMFTLLYRALGILDELPEAAGSKTTSDFGDAGLISSYAQEAMNALVQAGIISGSGGKLNPTGTTTRAEMAQVLYNLLSA